jgi:hypothetical protein
MVRKPVPSKDDVPVPVAVRSAVRTFDAVCVPVPEPVAERRVAGIVVKVLLDVPVPEPLAVRDMPPSESADCVPVPDPVAWRATIFIAEAVCDPVPDPVAVRSFVTTRSAV